LKTRNILAGHGRGLLQTFGHYLVPERWWGARIWPKLTAGLDPWIVEMLDSHRKIILQIEARMDQLEENTTSKPATLIEESAVRGLGERARAQMRAEVLDWHRFNNRSQVAALSAAVRANTPAEALADSAPLIAWVTSACAACLWRPSGVFTCGIRAGADFRSSIMFWDLESKLERLPKRKPLWPVRGSWPSICGESKPVKSNLKMSA